MHNVFSTSALFSVLVFGVVIHAFSEPTHQLRSLFLLDRGVSLSEQGLWSAAALACSSMGSFMSKSILSSWGEKV